MLKRTKRAYARTVSSCALVFSAMLLLASPTLAEDIAHRFDIPAESTAQALNDLSTQSGIQILFPYDIAAKTTAPAIKGSYSLHVVLAQLLAGSGLEIASETEKTITLRAVSDQVGAEAVTEVIVTGTHIRGGNPTSPVHTVTRKEIEISGYSQVGDVMRSLPENFSGGQNPGVIGADLTNGDNYSSSGGSAMNLRGLGSGATLVLVNGHRLSGDMYFQGADISSIPLGAIQRVEVVTDGASAIYGADAVAGVVNMVLRRNFDGAEISVRGGAATQGGMTERTISALAGKSGIGSYVLGDIEYSKTDGITTADRDFTSAATTVSSLVRPTTRHSLFISAGHTVSDTLSVAADAVVSDRTITGVSQQQPAAARYFTRAYTPSYALSLTVNASLPGDWKLNAIASATGSRNSYHTTYPAYAYSSTSTFANWGQYIELNTDGTLWRLPSGDIRLAAGTGYRTEGYKNGQRIDEQRNVTYAFAEALVPLIQKSVSRTGLHELELSLAARAETYSDFGSSTNPKIGVRYVPFDTLTVRGTWSKSFKAPSFVQMYDRSTLYLWNATDVGGTGPGTALMTYGGNPNLDAEKSTSKTVGADFSPGKRLDLSATWFAVDYTGRIVQPVSNYFAALSNPVYAPFIEANPTAERQADLIAAAQAFNNYSSGAYDPATVVAVIQDQYLNATAQSVEGVDLSVRDSWDMTHGTLSAFGNATWTRLKQQTSTAAPNVTLSGTLFNVPKFKARGGVSWSGERLTATAIANFVAPETDNVTTPTREVGSWTTVDATVAYQFPTSDGLSKGTSLTLSISNLLDRAPPRALGPAVAFPGLAFDSTNASIVGRFVSLTLKKAW